MGISGLPYWYVYAFIYCTSLLPMDAYVQLWILSFTNKKVCTFNLTKLDIPSKHVILSQHKTIVHTNNTRRYSSTCCFNFPVLHNHPHGHFLTALQSRFLPLFVRWRMLLDFLWWAEFLISFYLEKRVMDQIILILPHGKWRLVWCHHYSN
jgi:hypothetical protein